MRAYGDEVLPQCKHSCRRKVCHLPVKCALTSGTQRRPCWGKLLSTSDSHELILCIHVHVQTCTSPNTCIVENWCTAWRLMWNFTDWRQCLGFLFYFALSCLFAWIYFFIRGQKKELQKKESTLTGVHSQSLGCPDTKGLVPLLPLTSLHKQNSLLAVEDQTCSEKFSFLIVLKTMGPQMLGKVRSCNELMGHIIVEIVLV